MSSSKEAPSDNEAKFLKKNSQETRNTSSGTYKDEEVKDKTKLQDIHLTIGSWSHLIQAIYQVYATNQDLIFMAFHYMGIGGPVTFTKRVL